MKLAGWGERCAWVAFASVVLTARLVDSREGIGRLARDAGQWFRDAREQLRWASDEEHGDENARASYAYKRENVENYRKQLARVAGDLAAEAGAFADALVLELRER